jgi:CO dehydrogenase/acetyl-CoA synthase gamma subunit (corrinoid Fe-S protein)
MNSRSLSRTAIVIASFMLFAASAPAVRELVVIAEPQLAQRVEGIVLDPSGAPIAGMTVTDRTENWVAVLRTAMTDRNGRFHFSSQAGKNIYNLRFDHPGFNPLELKLKLDKRALDRAITVKAPIGG